MDKWHASTASCLACHNGQCSASSFNAVHKQHSLALKNGWTDRDGIWGWWLGRVQGTMYCYTGCRSIKLKVQFWGKSGGPLSMSIVDLY